MATSLSGCDETSQFIHLDHRDTVMLCLIPLFLTVKESKGCIWTSIKTLRQFQTSNTNKTKKLFFKFFCSRHQCQKSVPRNSWNDLITKKILQLLQISETLSKLLLNAQKRKLQCSYKVDYLLYLVVLRNVWIDRGMETDIMAAMH